jgi:SAM-dependent methyltransferase
VLPRCDSDANRARAGVPPPHRPGRLYHRDVQEEWDRFFDELYLEAYASRLAAFDSDGEARAAAELASAARGAEVLDCPCGFGRHSIPLADAGYRVTGVDRSPTQLEEARARAGDRAWPRLVQADYRKLPFEPASFDAAMNLFTGIGYYGEDADRAAFAEVRRVLRPGARFVLETMHRDLLMSVFAEKDWDDLGDGAITFEQRSFDHVGGAVETSLRLVRADGGHASFDYRIRTYTATELAGMLRDAGFTDVEFFGGLIEREPVSRERRLVAVAAV